MCQIRRSSASHPDRPAAPDAPPGSSRRGSVASVEPPSLSRAADPVDLQLTLRNDGPGTFVDVTPPAVAAVSERTRAVLAFCPWIFDNFAVERIEARVFSSNPASCRVLEKAGFRREGRLRHSVLKMNVLMDQVVYAILRDESTTP